MEQLMDETASLKSLSTVGTSVSAGTKRKRNAEPKFYAVRIGYQPGIYHTWADCLEQVKGFKKATFKSFASLIDAERWLSGEDPSQSNGTLLSSSPKFYAVKRGRAPGIYTDWPSAQAQITGCTKPRHKCFATRIEAQRFLDEDETKTAGSPEATQADADSSALYYGSEVLGGALGRPAPGKRLKKNLNGANRGTKAPMLEYNEADYSPGTGPLPPGAEDGFDPNIILDPMTGQVVFRTPEQRQNTKIQRVAGSNTETIRIHTDGSSLRNGGTRAFAGVGVYFGPSDPRNVSESLPGARQTNQRAELMAILRALETAPRHRDVCIITDSRYAIDCVTVWHINWRSNGWKTSNGKTVENKDLVENILNKIEERSSLRAHTEFEWVKGHANHPGNIEADKLAVNGARQRVM